MAAQALSTTAPSANHDNDNSSLTNDELWHRLIVLLTAFNEAAGVITWQARLTGRPAAEFAAEIVSFVRTGASEAI